MRMTSAVRAGATAVALALASSTLVNAQTFGLATMQPGSLNHTTGSAIAKVVKEKAGLNTLVQPTAGETVIIPLVGRGETEFGLANALEVSVVNENNRLPDLRLIGVLHPLPTAYFVRKDSAMRSMADLKGKKIVWGFSAQRTIDIVARAMLATVGLTDKDITPVLVPNVIRGADDFISGAVDTFYFAFGAPKVREVDATVGGIRALEVPESGMPAARKFYADGYLAPGVPNGFFIGVEKPMGIYTWDNMIFTNAKVPDDVVYKFIDTLEKNKAELVTIQPALRDFSAAALYKKYDLPYHPGALKYFKDHNIQAQAIN